jgi:outer membrane immunogenic protein
MKKSIVLVAALLASTVIASAADLPSTNEPAFAPVTAAPLFSWTGGYAGVNVGYGWGDFNGGAAAITGNNSGWLGGVQAGYNYQMNQIVLGVEADWQLSNLESNIVGGGTATVDNFGTVRARVGVAVDRFMPYLTGGYAFGNATVDPAGIAAESNFHHGWVIGAGVEYAWTDNLTTKIEGLWLNLADERYGNVPVRAGYEGAVLRAGLNFKF